MSFPTNHLMEDSSGDPVEYFCGQIAMRFFGMDARPNPAKVVDPRQADLVILNHPAMKEPFGIWAIFSPILSVPTQAADFGLDPQLSGYLTVDQLQNLRQQGAEKYWILFFQCFGGDPNQGTLPAFALWAALADKFLARFDSADLPCFRQLDRFYFDLRETRQIRFSYPKTG